MELSRKAMLVSLSISQWSGRAEDKQVSAQVATENATTVNAGRYNKNVLDKRFMTGLTKVVSEARQLHLKFTLPWTDKGARILPADKYEDYAQNMGKLKNDFETQVKEFLIDYPAAVQSMRSDLGNLFKEDDYPSVLELEEKYAFNTIVMPLPDSNDFRVALSDDEIEKIQAQMEKEMRVVEQNAMSELFNRLYKAVSHMAESLPKFDPEKKGKEKGIFRDSLVSNLVELVELLPAMNITDDPVLTDMIAKAEKKLTKYEPKELRESEFARNETAKAANDIMADMSSWMAPAQQSA